MPEAQRPVEEIALIGVTAWRTSWVSSSVLSVEAIYHLQKIFAEALQAERDRSSAEIAELKKRNFIELIEVAIDASIGESMSVGIMEAIEELKAQSADTQRLDKLLWLRSNHIQWRVPMNDHGWRLIIDGRAKGEGKTQREAIDAMRESEGK